MISLLICIVKKCKLVVTQLFIRGRKTKHIYCFNYTILFFHIENIRLNPTDYFIMKNPNKQMLQRVAINHSSDI